MSIAESIKPQSQTAAYWIAGLCCPHEGAQIRNALGNESGIEALDFDYPRRQLKIRHRLPSLDRVEAALLAIGMAPERLPEAAEAEAEGAGRRHAVALPWKKLALAGAFAAAAELLEFRLFPAPAFLPLAFALAAIALSGVSTYKSGWQALIHRQLNINALMAIAVTGALLIGQFPEAAMVMVLFNLAEAMEARTLEKAKQAIGKLMQLAPETATVQAEDGQWQERDCRHVPPGSRIRVKPGQRVALDGIVVSGQPSIDQSPVTGESLPVEKAVGDPVFAGTVNASGEFEFRSTAAFDDSTLARIIHAVSEAQGARAPAERLIDRFAAWYTPAVFLLALGIALVPPVFFGGEWHRWIYAALVMLVIGCPCALVISTPVTIIAGMSAAARAGILIKGGRFLEAGRSLKHLALDKTGTLTTGRPELADCLAAEGGTDAWLAVAASLAARSDHPVSEAIAKGAKARGLALLPVEEFAGHAGLGVSGRIAGKRYRLGKLQGEGGKLAGEAGRLAGQGKSVAALVEGDSGKALALFAVADKAKPGAALAVAELHRLGIAVTMLTGDNEGAAKAVADAAGIDAFHANLLPEEKLAHIKRLAQGGKTGMAGDGINDAPALAGADIGFAMAAAGSDTAMEAADVALMDDDLRKIPRFVRLSRRSIAILKQNIALAVGIKLLFLALAACGIATLWMAVFADVGTSLLVVANALRAGAAMADGSGLRLGGRRA